MTASVPFVALLRRATHSGYKELVMNNRMLMQCYNLDIDSDIGFHYVLYIPDTEEYSDKFYDNQIIINPRAILDAYAIGHKKVDAARKEIKAKGKDVVEEFAFKPKGDHAEIKFMFYLKEELICTTQCSVSCDVDSKNSDIANIERAYYNLAKRIKMGGACLLFDGLRLGIQEKAMNASEIYFYHVKFNGHNIRVPFARSMFMGIKEVDKLLFSIQESNIQDIYVYSMQLTKKNITEQLFGFLLSF